MTVKAKLQALQEHYSFRTFQRRLSKQNLEQSQFLLYMKKTVERVKKRVMEDLNNKYCFYKMFGNCTLKKVAWSVRVSPI